MIRKILVCMLALSMLCSAALAQISDGPVAEFDGCDWSMLEDVNVLVRSEGNVMFLCDLQGNRLSEGYSSISDIGGYILVQNETESGKVMGVLKTDGTVMVPANARDISVCSGYINAEAADGTVQAYSPDGALLDAVPSQIYDFDYIPEEEMTAKADKDMDLETTLYALTDLNGNPLTGYIYEYISVYELYGSDYCRTSSEDDFTGLLKYTGEVIFPAEYEEILLIDSAVYETRGIFAACRDDVVAFSQKAGTDGGKESYVVTEIPLEDADDVEFFGYYALVEYEDDTYAIARPDGTLSRLAVDDCRVYPVGDQIFIMTEVEDPETEDEFTVLYDADLNELLRTEWMMSVSRDGHVLLNEYGEKCYLYDLK